LHARFAFRPTHHAGLALYRPRKQRLRQHNKADTMSKRGAYTSLNPAARLVVDIIACYS
jgi:hypothetical protein